MADSDELQPSQKSLENIEEIDTILQEFGKWLQKVKFEPGKTKHTEVVEEVCGDSGLRAAAGRLLKALNFLVPSPS
jgi:hypothetical protein